MQMIEKFILEWIKIDNIFLNLDKFFSINFVMLAFLITALSILQTIKGGRIEDFKDSGLFEEVVSVFTKALLWNLIVGISICIVSFINISNMSIKIAFAFISIIAFFTAIYKAYKAYDFLAYFIKMQNKIH